MIICGDFGIWDDSKRERYNLNWLESRSFTTLFVAGNHDNYDILDSLPVSDWHGGKVNYLRPSVIHLMRGQCYDIDGYTFWAFDGASSRDIEDGILEPDDPEFKAKKREMDERYARYRINHRTWWERELPSEEEMRTGWDTLVRRSHCVDYIVTHAPSTAMLKCMDFDSRYKSDYLTDYLDEIQRETIYKHWYFGHMHANRMLDEYHATCLYEQIERIV